MKETIKHYFPLILTMLCAVFAIHILFRGFTNSSHGIFTDIGGYFSNYVQKDNLISIAEQIEAQAKTPLPTPKYIGKTLTVGEANSFDDLFALEQSDGSLVSISDLPTAALYLVDVKYSTGTSALTKFSSTDVENLEEIPSAAVYDTEKHLLYFHSSGIYTLYIRLYYDYRPGILFQCQVPVEVR